MNNHKKIIFSMFAIAVFALLGVFVYGFYWLHKTTNNPPIVIQNVNEKDDKATKECIEEMVLKYGYRGQITCNNLTVFVDTYNRKNTP